MRLLFLSAFLPLFGGVFAQVAHTQAPSRNLTQFEGRYEYRDGSTLFMVVSRERLIAIIGEAKYALRTAGPDTFTNTGGTPIPFVRDTVGRIVAFKENGATYRKLSSRVPAASRLLLDPRPRGSGGLTITYRYAPPQKLPDDIVTGEAGPVGKKYSSCRRSI